MVVPSPATSLVLLSGFLDELGAHVLVRVLQLDLLGDGDAVLGDGRAAPALVEDGVAAARPEGGADGAGQLADAGEQLLPGVVGVGELLGCHRFYPPWGNGGNACRGRKQSACRRPIYGAK